MYGDEIGKSAEVMPMGLGRLSKRNHTEQLEEKKKILEYELARVNKALEALKAHPEIESVMNLVSEAL